MGGEDSTSFGVLLGGDLFLKGHCGMGGSQRGLIQPEPVMVGLGEVSRYEKYLGNQIWDASISGLGNWVSFIKTADTGRGLGREVTADSF